MSVEPTQFEQSARIVIVEDERVVALDIRTQLQQSGYTVPAVYPSGEEAIANIETDAPDLVLLDIRLQGDLDGVETAQRIQASYGIPFILLTAYADEHTLERAKTSQPFAYIIKPFDERELRTAIVIALYRHRMEQALAERQELLDTTLRSITDGVVVTDDEDQIRFINDVALNLSGRTEERAIGESFDAVFAFEPIPPHFAAKGSVSCHAWMLVGNSGERTPVELMHSERVSPAGVSGSVYVLRDISERLDIERVLADREEQLRRSQKMEAVGRLSGGIAHDFNNLLTVILGYSRLLVETIDEDKSLDREDLRGDVLGIQKAAFRSVSLTRQLLAFSRHQVLSPRTIGINSIVSDIEKMLRRLLSEAVSFHVALEAVDGTVLVDQGQMEQVLMNLVLNARDALHDKDGASIIIRTEEIFTETERTVHSGTLEPGAWVVLHVQDNGAGIPEEHQQQLFEPFFTTKESARGTGLGLSTVYGIVRQLAGHIDVDSQVGRGSIFSVFLPKAVHEQQHDGESASNRSSASSQGTEVILLVEDDSSIRALLTRVLAGYGYHVVEAQNAGEAFLLAEEPERHIDLVVTDIVMPHVSGFKLVERLRGSREGLRFLLISGYAEDLADHDISGYRDVHVLQKPFEPEEFVENVRNALDA
ncbi:MAG: response regulator [Spirochaetales bacterium]